MGFCAKDVLVDVLIRDQKTTYQLVKPEMVEKIVDQHILGGVPVAEWLAGPEYEQFHQKQEKIVLNNCGRIDPEDINAYLAVEGYAGAKKALTSLTPELVIAEIKNAGLRGRGGAGFPTGIKWELCRKSPGDQKYIICNADEGDPGAFMDRAVIEGDPHAVIEGMLIGAYAMGASEGIVYIRAEYPLAIDRLKLALDQARDRGFLGRGLFGTTFDFDIRVKLGAGAFVCGEETAMIASLEDQIGEPRPRPPFPAQRGLWGKPTNINNVETWATVPKIIQRGAAWFSAIGTEKSKGTKIFSLVGKIRNTGLVEVPLGIPLREIIYGIGGGIPQDKQFKAVQTGGPSGGCIPWEHIDVPVDYEHLTALGSIVGSGGMVVLDEGNCMVDVAKFFVSFCLDESCGKCTPCREGTRAMVKILDEISRGEGTEDHLSLLEELCLVVRDAALCGLGKTAPNPVLSTLKYFREEYEAHIRDKYCPARVCKRLSPAPCQFTCPAGIDVPSYVALIGQGRFEEALNLIREDNPLPSICGYVCPAPCEAQCRRGEVDRPISIKSLKRFVSDFVREQGEAVEPAHIFHPQKIAVIGSGPAGLSAAYYLVREGYPVTVFETLPVLGGMLRVGIPNYRLPEEVLDFDIQGIAGLGVQFQTGTTVGRDISLDDLKRDGYAAFFLATGAHREVRLGIGGEERPGVYSGVALLRQVALGERPNPGKNVAVVGGGNVAMDAARTALRLGSRVTVLYRRTEAEMPAYAEEIVQAREEGVVIRTLTQPVEILGDERGLTGIVCLTMALGEPDASGRRRPLPVPGSETVLPFDGLIKAIGQVPEPLPLTLEGNPLNYTPRGLVEVLPVHLATNIPGLFAGGDNVSGPATVVEAVGAGKRAARSIHRYLQGEPFEARLKIPTPRKRIEPLAVPEEEIETLVRPSMPEEAVAKRIRDFCLVELGLSAEDCRKDAQRCLRCDLGD
ncbi:MAG: FAD-dependent oxidoreductase [Deltaproteobacteria bacterium]|nr:FAD-dependent oxidoreductase [Deltaproteobacteria bacterium]